MLMCRSRLVIGDYFCLVLRLGGLRSRVIGAPISKLDLNSWPFLIRGRHVKH
jgi:hypothetical protein